GSEDVGSSMSDEFDSLDATEKAAIRATLIRCRVLAAKIANELRNKKPEHFVDKLSLADLYASLEHAARLLVRRHTDAHNSGGQQSKSVLLQGSGSNAIIRCWRQSPVALFS